MSTPPSRFPAPRRARFSRHEGDRTDGLDETLFQAAMADQAALQEEQRRNTPARHVSSSLSPTSPFLPGYSLTVPSPTNGTEFRAGLARSVSPLHIPGRIVPHQDLTESPLMQEEEQIHGGSQSATRRAQFTISDEEEEEKGQEDESVPWTSCRDRRPTSAMINLPPSSESNEEDFEQGRQSIGSNSLLGKGRASLQITRDNKPGPLDLSSNLPRFPSPLHPRSMRPASEGMFPGTQRPSHESIHGSTPHIQRYDPFSSPSQVQLYTPRVTSSSSFKSPALKPALVRHDQSYENMACELGMAGTYEGQDQRFGHRGGIRNALASLYDRVVSSDDKTNHETDVDNEAHTSRPSRQRSSSGQSAGSAAINSRRGSDATILEEAPTLNYLTKRRKSMAFILGEDDEPREADDPRSTGLERKSMDLRKQYDFMNSSRRSSYSSEHFDTEVKPRKRSRSIASMMAPFKEFGTTSSEKSEKKRLSRQGNHSSLHSHMAERQKLILKLARALMLFGAPSHRVESQLNALSLVLAVDGQYIHFPGIVIASFGDIDHHTSECHFVKSKTDLALGHLNEVHTIYRRVITDKMTVHEATKELNRLLKAKAEWSILSRVAFNAIRCGIIAPMSFGGSFVDMFVAGAFGGALTFTQLYYAGNNPLFSNVFEVTAAIIISLLARLLSVKSVFCYQAVASAGLILVLPGYIILCGSLELASKNMIAGSVRLVYAIIYALFIGFGIAIGSDLYFVFDPAARKSIWLPLDTQTEVKGSFTFANETMPHWSGQFTFSNGTKNALSTGSINCERLPEWPWYRQPVDPLFNILFVPLFAFLGCFALLHPFKSLEVPVSVVIACIGYITNLMANRYIFGRSDVVSAIGSFAIGILGNAYSRVFSRTAFTAMTVAILFLVPNGLAMAGGLAMTYKGSDGDLYSNGLSIGLRMVQVSIGITTGLFASALVVYMFGSKRKNAHLFAF